MHRFCSLCIGLVLLATGVFAAGCDEETDPPEDSMNEDLRTDGGQDIPTDGISDVPSDAQMDVALDIDEDILPLDPNEPPLPDGVWYRPGPQVTWHWQLTGDINMSYDVDIYDVDLFDTPAATIAALQADGRRVICYFSAGSSENWRDDFAQFPAEVLGEPLDGWEGERWLDIRSMALQPIMRARLDLAAAKGCDGVEPDNVDSYDNGTGFPLTRDDQLAYNRRMANDAHRRGLAVALKNTVQDAAEYVAYYDFTVNEECHEYNECGELLPFVQAGKPILNAEYGPDNQAQADARGTTLCPEAIAANTCTLILPLDLDDSFRTACH